MRIMYLLVQRRMGVAMGHKGALTVEEASSKGTQTKRGSIKPIRLGYECECDEELRHLPPPIQDQTFIPEFYK